MELIQKQSNQEPGGNMYLEKGSKKHSLVEWSAAGPCTSVSKSFTTDIVKKRPLFAPKFHSEALILG